MSSDDGGAIYEWEISTGNRLFDCVEKEMDYVDIMSTNNISSTITLSKCGRLRDITDGIIISETKCTIDSVFSAISMTNHSRLIVAGTLNGYCLEIGHDQQERNGIHQSNR